MQILVPSKGPDSWRALLADPKNQWRDGYSAKELAQSWEAANGWPDEVAQLFRSSDVPALRTARPLLGIPEHKVPLPGGAAASQNDLFVLASGDGELIAIAVEGKANESFGATLDTWLAGASRGKLDRLAHLQSVLGLQGDLPGTTRYQLLHRAASSVIEARRFGATMAVLLIHCFARVPTSLNDYHDFVALFGSFASSDRLIQLGESGGIRLYAGWSQAT